MQHVALTLPQPNASICVAWEGDVMSMDVKRTIHTVVFKDGEFFIASAVEVDIAAQGKTLDEALTRLGVTVRAELAERNDDLSAIGPAPEAIQRMFKGPDSRVISRDLLAA